MLARQIVYSMGPVGMAFEYYETGKIRPHPLGIAGWMGASGGAMYGATAFANHASVGAQTAFSVYGPVLAEEIVAGAALLPAGTLPALGVVGIIAAGIGTMIYIDSLEPGTEEYSTMSALATNLRM